MAFQWSTQYEIQNIYYGTYINLYGNHSGGIPPGNVIPLWPRSGSVDQKWMSMPYANAARVVCPRDVSSSMNRHSTNNSAIMWPTSGSNVNDTEIDFITVNRDQNLYRLKLSRRNLYLTATGSHSMLYWRPATNDNTQLFKLIGGGGGTITMPDIINQYYTGNSTWIKTYGCALFCGVVMAEWKNGKDYTLANFAGHYDTAGNGYFCLFSFTCFFGCRKMVFVQ